MQAHTLVVDTPFDADKRALTPLATVGKTAVIPPKANGQVSRACDRDIFKARDLIENFFARSKRFHAIETRYDMTKRNFLAAIRLAAAVTWLN